MTQDYEPKINIVDEPEQPKDDILSKFDGFFEGIGSGWSLLINRTAPKEYAGFLEEIPITDNQIPVDLGYLAEKWGGDVLSLNLRSPAGVFSRRILVEMRTYPPKRRGRFIDEIEKQEIIQTKQPDILEILRLTREFNPPQPSPMAELVPLLKLFFERSAQPIVQPAPTQAVQLTEMLGAMAAMRDFVSPAPEGGDAMLGSVAKIAETLLQSKLLQQSQPKPPAIAPAVVVKSPAHNPIPALHPNPSPPKQIPTQTPKPPAVPDSMPEIDEQKILEAVLNNLGQMSGEAITEFYLDTLEKLPQDKREAAFKHLDTALGIEPIEEPDEPEPIRRKTENAETEVSGGQPVAGEKHAQSNRAGNPKKR